MSNLNKSVFSFCFDLEDVNKFRMSYFTIDVPHPCKKLEDLVYSEEFSDLISQNEEKFGVHDVSCGNDEVIGYTSYEVESSDVSKVMNNIANFFKTKGYTVSDIMFDEKDYVDEEDDTYDKAQEYIDKKYNEFLNRLRC